MNYMYIHVHVHVTCHMCMGILVQWVVRYYVLGDVLHIHEHACWRGTLAGNVVH